MISDEIFKDLIKTLLVLLFFLEILKKKKKALKKKAQSTGHFQSLFSFYFSFAEMLMKPL